GEKPVQQIVPTGDTVEHPPHLTPGMAGGRGLGRRPVRVGRGRFFFHLWHTSFSCFPGHT
ncbi:MAG: hypothetical protein KAU35_10185, partial [candidate division Zixibacteria bacterium]|nr:hypothetical protein [candidate division Zixibacteria bacterium]